MSTQPPHAATQTTEQLFDETSSLVISARATLALLRELEDRWDMLYMPVKIRRCPNGGVAGLSWSGHFSLAQVNNEVLGVARAARAVLPHLKLSRPEAEQVLRLAGDGDEAGTDPPFPLLMSGTICEEGEAIPADVRQADRLRLRVMVCFVEKLTEAGEVLRRVIDRRLHPPTVKDRVQVERNGRVTVDGHTYEVSESHATLLFHLVEANGATVSGPEIAKKEDVTEFKASRLVSQIKKRLPQLGAIIAKVDKTNGRYYLQLPPLAE